MRMRSEFEMSMMGELGFFLGFEIKQRESGTFINQSKYTRELIKKFGLEGGKSMNTPMSPNSQLDKDTQGKHIDRSEPFILVSRDEAGSCRVYFEMRCMSVSEG